MMEKHDQDPSGTDGSSVGGYGYGDNSTVGQSDKTDDDVRNIELEKKQSDPDTKQQDEKQRSQ